MSFNQQQLKQEKEHEQRNCSPQQSSNNQSLQYSQQQQQQHHNQVPTFSLPVNFSLNDSDIELISRVLEQIGLLVILSTIQSQINIQDVTETESSTETFNGYTSSSSSSTDSANIDNTKNQQETQSISDMSSSQANEVKKYANFLPNNLSHQYHSTCTQKQTQSEDSQTVYMINQNQLIQKQTNNTATKDVSKQQSSISNSNTKKNPPVADNKTTNTTTQNVLFTDSQHPSIHNHETQQNGYAMNSHMSKNAAILTPNTQQNHHDTNNDEITLTKVLSLDQDEYELSPYQCLVRKQIEVFQQPTPKHFDNKNLHHQGGIVAQGRIRPIIPGQVGIRCRHCGEESNRSFRQGKGAILFPSNLLGVYQVAQNMANTHLLYTCKLIPTQTREELFRIRTRETGKKTRKSAYGGGRQYWADSLSVLGVVEGEDRRLYFSSNKKYIS